MDMSKFLVTGGAGFIGSNIVDRLIHEGRDVRVLDNFSSGKMENLHKAQIEGGGRLDIVNGDIRDKAVCEKACEGVDFVLHQAALRSVPKSMKDPDSYNDVNIQGTLNMLQAASKKRVQRFVSASSSSVYGDVTKFPEREDFYPRLISPYALSKLANEHYGKIFAEFFEVPFVALRYFNVFGPKQALDDEYAVVIPKFITCILKGEQPPIFGTGKQSRDFTYIDDVVEANILAATRPNIKFEVMNVANGRDTTVLDLVVKINKILGKNVTPKLLPIRPGDVFKTLADTTRLRRVLGFKSLVGFDEGLRRTVEYFRNKI
jgi:nucleoside-diphosphate-sugar epimerase